MFRARELLLGAGPRIDSETAGDHAGPSIVAEGNEFTDLLYRDRREFNVELPPHQRPDDPFAECATWGLPFFVEENHIVREGLLQALQAAMEVTHEAALTACHGFGGVGKTQMARYYCEFVQQQTPTPYRFIGWVQGSDEESVKGNLIALGQGLGLVAYDCKPDIALAQIKNFFEHNDGWLLVFDNIQDTEWLDDLLPHGVGHVLVTTRNEHWDRGETIPVDVMTKPEAIALLERISGREDPAFEAIAEQLGYLPLALVQAASFIRLHVTDDTPIETYLTLYETAQRALLDFDRKPLGDMHDPVTITWLMNFKELQARSPNAVRLLQAMRFLHHNNIPWSVLIRFMDEENACGDEARWLVREALADLSDYSLIQNDTKQQQLSMHVLIHTILAWWDWNEAKRKMSPALMSNLVCPDVSRDPFVIWEQVVDAVIVDVDEDNEAMEAFMHRQVLLPHLKALLAYGQSEEQQVELINEIYRLLRSLIKIYFDLQDGDEGIVVCRVLLEMIREIQGEDSTRYAAALGNLGTAYVYLGDYGEAKECLERALAIRVQAYGKTHPKVSLTQFNLAVFYFKQKRFLDACSVMDIALHTFLHFPGFGKNHPYTQKALRAKDRINQKLLLLQQLAVSLGVTLEAAEAQLRVQSQAMNAFGDLPAISPTKKIKKIQRMKIDDVKKIKKRGVDAYRSGNFERAIGCFESVLDSAEDLPLDERASIYYNLARSHEQLLQFEDAVSHYMQAIALLENDDAAADAFETHQYAHSLLKYHQGLAALYRDHLIDHSQGLIHFNHALDLASRVPNTYNQQDTIQQSIRDINRKQALDDVLQVGIASFKSGDYDQALRHFQQALVHGKSIQTMNVSETINNLYYNVGSCYLKLEKNNSAEKYLQDCYEWRLEHFGVEHAKTQKVKVKLDALASSTSNPGSHFR